MLVELMVVLGLLAVVGLIATQIFVVNLRTSSKLAEEHQEQMQFDQATNQLRRDVWNASSLTLQGPQELQIGFPDGQTITWHAGKLLDRTFKSEARRWDAIKTNITFELHGPIVTLVVEPTQSEAGGKIVLVSQAVLLKGGGR
jgi:hypothetical protein